MRAAAVCVALAVLVGSLALAEARSVFVNPSGTDWYGCGTASGPCATLAGAISVSKQSDTIVASGTFSGAGNVGIYLQGQVTLTSQGQAAIDLTSTPNVSAFILNDTAPISISNFQFNNGFWASCDNVDCGAVAIRSRATVTFTGCSWNNNSANVGSAISFRDPLPLSSPSFGAAADSRSPNGVQVTLVKCSFANSGGVGNRPFSGGAVFFSGDTMVVQACQFTNNIAGWGGAIYFYGGRGLISLSTFSGNHADALGGGIRFSYAGDSSVSQCTFQNGYTGFGGALSWDGTANTLNVSDCSFSQNTCPQGSGAALNAASGNVLVTQSTFLSNNAPQGGAVAVVGPNSKRVLVPKGSDQAVPAELPAPASSLTRLVRRPHDDTRARLQADGCTFSGNSAQQGEGDDVFVSNARFSAAPAANNGGFKAFFDHQSTVTSS